MKIVTSLPVVGVYAAAGNRAQYDDGRIHVELALSPFVDRRIYSLRIRDCPNFSSVLWLYFDLTAYQLRLTALLLFIFGDFEKSTHFS